MHLAQFNISRNRYPLDDPRMQEFLDNVERVHRLAEQIDGFVWRLHDETGHAMNIRVYDDPEILPNLTVWRDVEALERFVWQTLHKRMYKPPRRMVRADRRREVCDVVDSGRTSTADDRRRRAARLSAQARPERSCLRLGPAACRAIVEDCAVRA